MLFSIGLACAYINHIVCLDSKKSLGFLNSSPVPGLWISTISSKHQVKRWEENWDQFAWPLFASLLSLSPSTRRDDPSDDGGSGSPARGCGRTSILTKRQSYGTIIVPAVVILILSLLLSLPRLFSRIEDIIAAAQATAERWCMWPR